MYTKELYRRAQAITHSLDSPWSGMTIGPALEAAILSGNNTGYNILAQEYNNGINGTLSEDEAKKEWIALKPTAAIQDLSGQSVIGTKQPFNSSNTLGQFGKQQVYDSSIYQDKQANQVTEMDAKNKELEDFLKG